eukprot:scaffold60199_cov49-Phaeocystis_antarctica.AAC.3
MHHAELCRAAPPDTLRWSNYFHPADPLGYPYATQGSNPRLADRVPGGSCSATHAFAPRLALDRLLEAMSQNATLDVVGGGGDGIPVADHCVRLNGA